MHDKTHIPVGGVLYSIGFTNRHTLSLSLSLSYIVIEFEGNGYITTYAIPIYRSEHPNGVFDENELLQKCNILITSLNFNFFGEIGT